ncbi:MAG: hypothetical protein AAFR81_15995 [Chloroflexota bacterium]
MTAKQLNRALLAIMVAISTGFLVRMTTDSPHHEPNDACTLDALEAIADGGTLYLDDDCVLMVTPAVTLTGDVTIQGGLLHSGGIDRVLIIAEGANVTLTDTMVLSGAVEIEPRHGGGILNYGALTLVDSIVAANSALQGGGIYNAGNLVIVDSIIARNSAREGGGIYNTGTLSITDSLIESNNVRFSESADYGGYGAGLANKGIAIIVQTHIMSNRGDNEGIGIDTSGTLIMHHSVIMNNICLADDCRGTGLFRYAGYVNARYNYWGSADGPGGDANGNGDSIINLDSDAYTPFLTTMPD